MSEWQFAQRRPEQRLAMLSQYSVMKEQDGKQIEFLITVKEYMTPRDPMMKFYAESDRETNQHTGVPYRPTGWGPTLLKALSQCIEEIERFPCSAD
jgi:hypothetical protein